MKWVSSRAPPWFRPVSKHVPARDSCTDSVSCFQLSAQRKNPRPPGQPRDPRLPRLRRLRQPPPRVFSTTQPQRQSYRPHSSRRRRLPHLHQSVRLSSLFGRKTVSFTLLFLWILLPGTNCSDAESGKFVALPLQYLCISQTWKLPVIKVATKQNFFVPSVRNTLLLLSPWQGLRCESL